MAALGTPKSRATSSWESCRYSRASFSRSPSFVRSASGLDVMYSSSDMNLVVFLQVFLFNGRGQIANEFIAGFVSAPFDNVARSLVSEYRFQLDKNCASLLGGTLVLNTRYRTGVVCTMRNGT